MLFSQLIHKEHTYFCATDGAARNFFFTTTLCRGMVPTHVSKVAPNWDLGRTLHRLSYSAVLDYNFFIIKLQAWASRRSSSTKPVFIPIRHRAGQLDPARGPPLNPVSPVRTPERLLRHRSLWRRSSEALREHLGSHQVNLFH